MKNKYFIMMFWQNMQGASPIVRDNEFGNEEVSFYKTYDEAKKIAEGHAACQAFGYEIFNIYEGAEI